MGLQPGETGMTSEGIRGRLSCPTVICVARGDEQYDEMQIDIYIIRIYQDLKGSCRSLEELHEP